MRTLLALVLSLWVFAHYAAAEKKRLKTSGRCFAQLHIDPFTKNQSCKVYVALQKDGLWTTGFVISPNETAIADDGKLVPWPFFQMFHERESNFPSITGVIIDGERQPLQGAGWKKNLVEAMKAGNTVVMRGDWGERTRTMKGSLSGFTACWNAVPKEFIDLEDEEVEADEEKEAESDEKKESPEKAKE